MRIFAVSIFLMFFLTQFANGQYDFKATESLKCTKIKSQDKTGTCWSFATTSFFESELLRMGKGEHDLSEMFTVREVYKDKALNYVLRQGKANFSQGSLSHDLIRVLKEKGAMPQSAYEGKDGPNAKHNHSEMEGVLAGMLNGIIKQKRVSNKWKAAYDNILDVYLGPCPKSFKVDGKQTNPTDYAESLGLNAADYVNITSFTHHPFYETFVLEIPDNYSNGSFYNIPIDELQAITTYALENGYTVAWDGDVSEKGFSAKEGIAVLPVDEKREDLFMVPGPEMSVSQAMRQDNFENYSTTDDHLMHAVGMAKDKKGNKYYMIKNSWGEISPYKGYLYMSEAYYRLKSVSILVHKDAIPKDIATKLQL